MGASILIVDDNHDNLRFLMNLLSEHEYIVRPVADGAQALSAAQADPPDLILLDIMMPGISGYEICEKFKTDERTRDIPVIFISALQGVLDKVRAFFVGGVDYITKPFQSEEVLARIETHLAIRELQKHLQQKNMLLEQEIAERKKFEASLKKSEQRYRSMFENATAGIFQATLDGQFIAVNSALTRILGYASARELGKTVKNISRQLCGGSQQWKEITDLARTSQEPVRVETRCRDKDGREILIYLNIWAVRDQEQKVRYVEGFMIDITEQQQLEETLVKEHNLLSTLIESLPEIIYIKDRDGRFLLANNAMLDTIGATSQGEVLGKTAFDFYPAEMAEKSHKAEQEILTSGQPILDHQELLIDPETGMTRWLLSSEVPFRDHQNAIVGLVGLKRDITLLKHSEKTLQAQAILLRGVTEAMRRLVISDDLHASITEALEVLGFVMGVDRISIYETHYHPETNQALMSQRFTWTQELSEVQKNNPKLQNIPYARGLSRWYKILSSNRIIYGPVQKFPQSERMQPGLRDVISILVAPIIIHQRFWGFIGFEDCQTEWQWNELEKFILLAMAESIGGAIARQQA